MNAKSSAVVAALLLAFPLVACSAPTEEDETSDSDGAAMTAAQSQCGTAEYAEASSAYKRAVDGANRRASSASCSPDSDASLESMIAFHAESAVGFCGAFKNVIKTSSRAKNLRQVLQGTLTYPIVVGDLDPTTWNGLAGAMVGVTLHGQLGESDAWQVTFKANGLGSTKTTGAVSETKAIRWSIVQQNGQTFVRIVGQAAGGADVTHDYLVKRESLSEVGPSFTYFEVQEDPNDAFPVGPYLVEFKPCVD